MKNNIWLELNLWRAIFDWNLICEEQYVIGTWSVKDNIWLELHLWKKIFDWNYVCEGQLIDNQIETRECCCGGMSDEGMIYVAVVIETLNMDLWKG